MRSRYWRRKACQPDSFFLSASLLGPYFCSALLRFGGAQALGGINLQLFGDVFCRQARTTWVDYLLVVTWCCDPP